MSEDQTSRGKFDMDWIQLGSQSSKARSDYLYLATMYLKKIDKIVKLVLMILPRNG